MATQGPTNLPAYFSGNADFEAFVTGVHNALAALGFVQTADTGQINPATVAAPAATNTSAGYEIWRFADTLQATVPIFFKVEYGTGSAVNIPAIWITVGSGSNGTGGLTGQVGSRMNSQSNAAKAAGVQLPLYMSSTDLSDLTIAFNVDVNTTSFGSLWHISRPRDHNGAPTNEGVYCAWLPQNGSYSDQFISATGAVGANSGNAFPGVHPGRFGHSSGGENADICPPLLPLSGAWRYTKFAMTGAADFGAGGTFVTVLFGVNHTFLALAKAVGDVNGNNLGNQGTGNPGWAMAWE